MIDTDKYEGHTEGPWSIRSPVSQVTKKYRDSNEGKIGFPMSDWPSYGVAGVGPCSIRRYMDDRKSEETWHANIHLVADAPLLLEEVLRLQRELDTQYGYIEWLEEFAPKVGDYNTAWDAYEAQMEEEE